MILDVSCIKSTLLTTFKLRNPVDSFPLEYKEFEKLIQEDLKEVDNRMEEEEYDAAEMIEEAETEEQKSCMEVVEMFKRKKMELKAARSTKRGKVVKVVEKESSDDESSSDEDSDDAIDWRAKHL